MYFIIPTVLQMFVLTVTGCSSRLLSVFLGTRREPWRWSSDLTVFARAIAHHFGVDGARNTVMQLGIQFRQLEFYKQKIWLQTWLKLGQLYSDKLTRVNTGLSDISHSSSFNNVTNDKLLDSLVLCYTACTVSAANCIDMSTSVLGASVVSAFLSLRKKFVTF